RAAGFTQRRAKPPPPAAPTASYQGLCGNLGSAGTRLGGCSERAPCPCPPVCGRQQRRCLVRRPTRGGRPLRPLRRRQDPLARPPRRIPQRKPRHPRDSPPRTSDPGRLWPKR
ncbi:unnamed protein product, partial [Ectocarpus sp. 12 AP-2014]